jgi:hypothetical protein
MQQIIPQLWISQTLHLFISRHKEGLVDAAPKRYDMNDHFTAWEDKNQETLRALVGLIVEIKEALRNAKNSKEDRVCWSAKWKTSLQS